MPGLVQTKQQNSQTKLMEAVRNDDSHWLLHLLKQSDVEQSELDAALHTAAWSGQTENVRLLLAAGADLYSVNQHGEPLLVEAVYSANVQLVRAILQAGYDVTLMHSGDTRQTGLSEPLHVAISSRERPNYDMVDLLVDSGLSLECKDVDGDTPLIAASNMVDARLAQRLLAGGCLVNAAGYEGNTALHRASESGSVDMVKLLVERGANVNVQNAMGNSALMVACENGQAAVVNLLLHDPLNGNSALSDGASTEMENHLQTLPPHDHCTVDVVNKDGRNCFHLAAASGNWELVQTLLDAGVSLRTLDSSGNTPLIVSTWARNFDFTMRMVEVMRQRPSDWSGATAVAEYVNRAGELGRTTLHWAALHGSADIVSELLSVEGINVNPVDEAGDTPLLLAARANRGHVLRQLVERQADVNVRGDMGRTALHWVVLAADKESVECLLAVDGVQVSIADLSGCTPLLLGAASHRYAEMRVIIRAGPSAATVNWAGSDGRTALHWICKAGCTDMVRELVSAEADVNVRDDGGDTALLVAIKERHSAAALELITTSSADFSIADSAKGRQAVHYASELGLIDVVRALVDAGTDINVTDVDGRTPVILATMNSHENIVQLLLNRTGCDVNVVDGTQRTSLFYAAQGGLEEAVRKLLEAGAAADQWHSEPSPLIQACRRGSEPVVTLLLARQAGINYRDARRRTAPMWAAEGGHDRIVNVLLAAGAEPLTEDSSGDTALTIAAWHGHRAVVKSLLPVSNIEHHEKDEGMTALLLAIAKDCGDIVLDLLQAGASIHAVEAKGNNALLTAMIHTSGSNIVGTLLDRAELVDVDFRGDQGRSAVHWAVGDPDCLRLLLSRKPDLDLVDTNGASALLLAIAHGRADSATMLIEAGCDFQRVHKDGRAAIHHAAIYGVCEIVENLLERGVPADTPTVDGKTSVLLASVEGHGDIVRVLIRHQCDINFIYQDAMTPLSAAASGKHLDVMEALLEAGADPNLFGSKKCSPLITCILNNDVLGTLALIQHGARLEQTLDDGNKRPIHGAIVNNYVTILHVLVAVECDVNLLRTLLKEGVVYYFVDDDYFLAFLKVVAWSPRPLQSLCRRAVRQQLTVPIMRKIADLPVPVMIKDFLAMRDVEKMLVGLLELEKQN